MAWMLATTGIPRCEACGSMVRPEVVLYEEALDEEVMARAMREIRQADLLVVGGTSLNVHPAAGLVRFCEGRIALVNRDETPMDHLADLVVHDSLGGVLGDAVDELLGA